MCSCMGSMSVSSCICCTFVSSVHPVVVLNAAFCMSCRFLMLVEDARGDHMDEAYSRVQVRCTVITVTTVTTVSILLFLINGCG